ncbi:MAG: hypothetical protein ACOYNC_09075 [Bacteroidales bacterium]
MKNILLSAVLLFITLSFTTENGKLSGNVTYKDIYELSPRVDAGGEIYAISKADAQSAQYGDLAKVVGQFMMSKSNYSQAMFNTIDPEREKKVQDYFDSEAKLTFNYITGFKKLPAVVKAKANEKGQYALNLKPGKYYVLFISGNVKSNNMAELKGNIDLKVIEVKSAGETLQNADFKIHENFPLMFLTGQWLQGC